MSRDDGQESRLLEGLCNPRGRSPRQPHTTEKACLGRPAIWRLDVPHRFIQFTGQMALHAGNDEQNTYTTSKIGPTGSLRFSEPQFPADGRSPVSGDL